MPPISTTKRRLARLRFSPAVRSVESRIAPAPKFVIVGTGRCGTKGVARTLRLNGVRCGHEDVFKPEGPRPRFDLRGDSSWFAVPELPDYDGLVLHQVREPTATIASLASRRMWAPDNPLRRLIEAAGVQLTDDPLVNSMRFYVEWNERCEQAASYRYRVEDIDQELETILGLIDPDRAEQPAGLRVAGTSENARPNTYSFAGLDDLPAGADRDRLAEQAERYGYVTAPEPGATR